MPPLLAPSPLNRAALRRHSIGSPRHRAQALLAMRRAVSGAAAPQPRGRRDGPGALSVGKVLIRARRASEIRNRSDTGMIAILIERPEPKAPGGR
jgi:hypothetical protein